MTKPNALKKAVQNTPRYKYQQLCAEESRWSRKRTIAGNKLKKVRDKIEDLMHDLLSRDEARTP